MAIMIAGGGLRVIEIAAPFDAYRDVVHPEWIESNQHMSMGHCVVVFDLATDEWLR